MKQPKIIEFCAERLISFEPSPNLKSAELYFLATDNYTKVVEVSFPKPQTKTKLLTESIKKAGEFLDNFKI